MKSLWYHLMAIAVVAVWGSTFVFTKLLLTSGLSAAQIFTLRFIIAYLLLLAFSLTRPSFRLLSSSWKDELLMLALGISGGSLYFLTENSAMLYTTTTNTSLIVCMCPLFAAAFISLFYARERLHGIQIWGTVLASIGVVIVVLNGQFILNLSPKGDLLAFMACICWAVYSLLIIPANARYNTLFVTRKVFFYGLVSMIPYFILCPEVWPWEVLTHPNVLFNILFLGCIASMVCFLVWNWVIKQLGSVTTTNYAYFNPVMTMLFAWLILSERITLFFILGTSLILMGMYFINKKAQPT